MSSKTREFVAAYLFLAPFLITLLIFFGFATARAVFYRFTDYDLFNTPEWVGLRNYANLLRDERFLTALRNSLVFAAVVTSVQTFGALVMAAALNRKIRGLNFFRAAFYMPSITSSVVISLIFLWMYQRRGLVNWLLTQFSAWLPLLGVFVLLLVAVQVLQVLFERSRAFPAGWFDPALFVISLLVAAAGTWLLAFLGVIAPRQVPPVDFTWLQTRQEVPAGFPFFLRAPIPLIAIMIQNIFTTIPTFMLIFLAALQDVPKSYYEAAALDGASPTQQFFFITIPAVQPVTFLVVTLGLISTLQMFDQVAIFGSAVPLRSVITLAYFVYDRMFPGAQLPEVGFASAAAIFLAVLTLLIVLVQRLFIRAEGSR
jgi:multiple sugar transport system permease protein